jgi:transposase-like protein
MWMLVNSKNGVSSWEIHRAMGVTQKSAWFMLQRGRLALQDPSTGGKLSGHVEVDETFIGAKARNMHKEAKARKIQGRRGPEGKAIVAAVLERGGRVKAKVIDRRKKKDLQALVRENVEPKSALYSDALKSYEGLSEEYAHQVIDHAVAYVDAATRNAAELLRVTDAGAVAASKSADFIVLDANPLDDITNTRRIAAVYLRGSQVDRAGLRARWTSGKTQ